MPAGRDCRPDPSPGPDPEQLFSDLWSMAGRYKLASLCLLALFRLCDPLAGDEPSSSSTTSTASDVSRAAGEEALPAFTVRAHAKL